MNDSCTKCPGGHYSPMRRRGFLQVGAVGAMGLTLADYFRMTARADDARTVSGNTAKEGQAKSVIQIFLPGGCPHQETWDPKPEAPVEYRGPLGVVKTKLPGIVFSEHLPKTAAIADKITVIRSIAGRIPDHAQASYHLLTGYLPTPAIQHPSMGAVVAQQFGPKNNLPPYVGVPNVQPAGGTGYLSSKYGAFEIGVDPTQKAFALDDEKQSTVDLYGGEMRDRNGNQIGIGRRLMMCRRLVEAGVRFVSVSYGGWDLHTNVKDGISRQLPAFDHAFAGLISDLEQRGLLDSTVVMVMSEFGRSPKVNVDAGRDHYSRCFSIACAGGGLTRGQIYGASNSTASEPDVDPVPVEDLLFTVYHQLGINADERLTAPGGRPIDIIRGGKLVKGLLAKA